MLKESILEVMETIRLTGWTRHTEPFKHSTVESVYIELTAKNPDFSHILNSSRFSCCDVSKHYSPDNPSKFNFNSMVVDEKLHCIWGLTMNQSWAVIVPRSYNEYQKRFTKRSIAEFFVNIIKKKIDPYAEIYLYSEYMEARELA